MIDAQNNELLKKKWLDLGYKFALYIYPDKKDRDEGETGHQTVFFEDFGMNVKEFVGIQKGG